METAQANQPAEAKKTMTMIAMMKTLMMLTMTTTIDCVLGL